MTEQEKFPHKMYVGLDLRCLFTDPRILFFIGLGLLISDAIAAWGEHPRGGFLAIAGSILMGSAVIGNSIRRPHDKPETEKVD